MLTKTLSETEYTSDSKNQLADSKDAEDRPLAKKLHDLAYIYALYGALDGLSLSYSMIKYLFDLMFATSKLSSAEEMHKWLVTPGGAFVAGIFSLGLIVFSFLGNFLDDDDQDKLKRYIAIAWPYVRALMKALKNAFKGFKSSTQIFQLLGAGAELKHLIVPVGLVLGILSAVNRIWQVWMISERKDMMKVNAALLTETQNLKELSLELSLAKLIEIQRQIKRQSVNLRFFGLVSAAYGGVVDGLYLYVGVFSLCTLVPPVLVAMTVFTAIYFIMCIATRMYEEYDFQQKLIISQAKIELAMEGKKLELLFLELQRLSILLSEDVLNSNYIDEQKKINSLFEKAVAQFTANHKKLRSLSTPSYVAAFLAGARNGLAAYGALSAILFMVGIMVASFPPNLLVSAIVLGMTLLIGFIIFSLVSNYYYRSECEENIKKTSNNLHDLKSIYNSSKQEVRELKPEEFKAMLDGMVVDPSPQFFFQEMFEVIRSFFSGVGKGVKAIDLTMAPLETPDKDGHFHETPVMVGFMVVSAFLHSLILGLRAYARGFGRDAIDAVPAGPKKENTATEIKTLNTVADGSNYSDADDELQPLESPISVKPPQSNSMWDSLYSFFKPQNNETAPNLKTELVKQHARTTPSLFNSKVNLSIEKTMINTIDFQHRAEGLELDHCTF